MNEKEWEYVLLHNLPKAWVPMLGETKTDKTQEGSEESKDGKEETKEQHDGANGAEGTQETKGEEVSGNGNSTGKKASESNGSTESGTKNTPGSGQTTPAQSGGRSDTGASGNGPSNPDKLPTGDAGKDQNGHWKTRSGGDGQPTHKREFSFQRAKRQARESKEASKG